MGFGLRLFALSSLRAIPSILPGAQYICIKKGMKRKKERKEGKKKKESGTKEEEEEVSSVEYYYRTGPNSLSLSLSEEVVFPIS